MIKERIPAIGALSLEEKRELAHELWAEVQDAELQSPNPALLELLTERWKQYVAEPATAITLEEFRKRLPPRE